MATNPSVRFFNPEPISYEQYSKGPVDFYNQALDTSSGINVAIRIGFWRKRCGLRKE